MLVGKLLAILADRIHYFEMANGAFLEDNRIVSGGITLCISSRKLWVISRKFASEVYLSSDRREGCFQVFTEDRIDSCLTAKLVESAVIAAQAIALSSNEKMEFASKGETNSAQQTHSLAQDALKKTSKCVFSDDDVTAVAGGE